MSAIIEPDSRRPILELSQITKSFGGLRSLDGIDLSVHEGEVVSIIGPNGAGKTTLFNVMTGVYQPDSGEILFDGKSLLGLSPNAVTTRGVARTFQTIRLFLNMSVIDNVMAAMYSKTKAGLWRSALGTRGARREEQASREKAEELLSFFGSRLMGYRWDQMAYSLSYANRRRLEIARAMATGARVLLLDEPAAGMNPAETHEITDVVGRLREERGYTIVVIEHDMHVVERISDRVVALDHGIKIADGNFHDVATHPEVVEAYLGRSTAAQQKSGNSLPDAGRTDEMRLATQQSPAAMEQSGDRPPALLQLADINTFYGPVHILQDVNLEVGASELVCLLGGNACGKSTTLKTILGLVKPKSGTIYFKGKDITDWSPAQRIAAGISVVPENRRLFAPMTVHENLVMGAYVYGEARKEDLDRVYTLFPRLAERRKQLAGTMSGGEQQMVAVGRALISHPTLLLMDEPSMGLSPRLVEQSFEIIESLHAEGISMLMIEQNANVALSVADRGYVLQTGRIVLSGLAAQLAQHDELRRAYLGR
ncbi:MAG: ATP-binding cassette domain-containing protein [Nakamurella sp.]